MSRSIWNGTITFGLIAVPIKVHSAVEDRTVHFHQVHAKDGARIKQRRVCAKEGKEVPYEQVAAVVQRKRKGQTDAVKQAFARPGSHGSVGADAGRDEQRTRRQRQQQASKTGDEMTHEEEKEPEPQAPAEESGSEQHEDDGLSPEAKEIEEDPSLNPGNEILRDIRGG